MTAPKPRWNTVDFLILILLLCLMLTALSYLSPRRTQDTDTPTYPISYSLELSPLHASIAAHLHVGDVLYDAKSGAQLGVITDCVVSAATYTHLNLDRTLALADHPELMRVLLQVEASARALTPVTLEQTVLRIGAPLSVKTADFIGNGFCKSIQTEERNPHADRISL